MFLFGRKSKDKQEAAPHLDQTVGKGSKLWVCPKCGGVIQRPDTAELHNFLKERGATVLTANSVNCPGCGAKYDRDAVQGGKYDVPYRDGEIFFNGSWRKMKP